MAVAARNSPVLSELCIAYPNVGVSVFGGRQHPKERIKWLEGAILIAREIGDRYGEGAGLSNLGNAYMVLGEARKAIDVYEQALVIDRQMADRACRKVAISVILVLRMQI